MYKASALTVSLLAAGLGVSALIGVADASEGRGTAPHFDGPVVVGGLCSGKAAYYGNVRQDGDTVVAVFHVRHAGVHLRWGLSTEASTDFGDGSGVGGAGDGFARSDANGHLTVHAATPLGVSHEFKVFLSRPKTGESCFIRVKL
jgi:hypothetical protein